MPAVIAWQFPPVAAGPWIVSVLDVSHRWHSALHSPRVAKAQIAEVSLRLGCLEGRDARIYWILWMDVLNYSCSDK